MDFMSLYLVLDLSECNPDIDCVLEYPLKSDWVGKMLGCTGLT
jgi:hypothetical protein